MRASGILLPVFSLPSDYGIGCFSKEAFEFIDFLSDSGQKYWQILPCGPTGFGDSPYQSFSTFAGNPYFISPEILIEKGLISVKQSMKYDFGDNSSSIDYGLLFRERFSLLREAFSCFIPTKEYETFKEKNAFWLEDYSLFMSIKEVNGHKPLSLWNKEIRLRNPEAINTLKQKLSEEMEFHKFIQYEFRSQWNSLKSYAAKKEIRIIGDIPIYVSEDSCDLWVNPGLFETDDLGNPVSVAGCPPDGFSKKGQLWGNPLYDWQMHIKTDFEWWKKRIAYALEMYDIIRIDHFRGLDEYYSIKAGSEDAVKGVWRKAPGDLFLENFKKEIAQGKIIAEDLGFITDSVKKLLSDHNIPGMKILQFAFDSRDSSAKNLYLPHNYTRNCVVYTGTHDNQTLKGWLETLGKEDEKSLREYICDYSTPKDKLCEALISQALGSIADTAVIPIQDYMELDDRGRINTPSTLGENWRWRIKKEELNEKLSQKILKLSKTYGRESKS